ncbi:hypothetical protein M8C13_35480 [Crossiella sp. SN42]|uniref:hypothetical protein n=1 Tax=Crossiella sp. SN42 TaxID=2944808 RepID=UPI00207C5136|nr:hypothetical protein [Crossiella sp. SN42]MCO1581067.1 hypothetical protein [Crossiella sp. SN42]
MRTRTLGVLAAAAVLTGLNVAPAGAATEPELHLPVIRSGAEHIGLNVVCDDQDWQPVKSALFTAPVPLKSYPGSPAWGYGTGYLVKDLKAGSRHTVSYGCGSVTRTTQVTVQPPETIGEVGLKLNPSSGRPGEAVKLVRRCDKRNKPNTEPVSAALDSVWYQGGNPLDSNFSAKVRADVKPGRYAVTIRCGAVSRSVFFTVLGSPGHQQPPPAAGGGQVKVKPVGGVETGGGDLG